jgi:hypothetical protein
VWTRHAHGIRGTLVGFLLAVDKHFNMVLSCLLHFTRKNSTRVWRLVHLHQFFVCHAHHLVLSFMIRSRKWEEDCCWWLHFYSLVSHPSPVRCLDFACKRCGVIIVVKQSQRYLMIVVEDQNCGLLLQEEHTHAGKCLPLLLSFRSFFFCRFCKMLMNSTQVRW